MKDLKGRTNPDLHTDILSIKYIFSDQIHPVKDLFPTIFSELFRLFAFSISIIRLHFKPRCTSRLVGAL